MRSSDVGASDEVESGVGVGMKIVDVWERLLARLRRQFLVRIWRL